MNILKKKRFIIVSVVLLFLFFVQVGGVLAADPKSTNYGLKTTVDGNATLKDILPKTPLPEKIGSIVGAVLAFIGILFFILIIYGGFLWMTARGNEEQVKKAIELITQAAIGLAIVASAYLVTRFIGDTLLSTFTTPG